MGWIIDSFKDPKTRRLSIAVLVLVLVVIVMVIFFKTHIKYGNFEVNAPSHTDSVIPGKTMTPSNTPIKTIPLNPVLPPTTKKSRGTRVHPTSINQKNEKGDNNAIINNGSGKNIFNGIAKDSANVHVGDNYYEEHLTPDLEQRVLSSLKYRQSLLGHAITEVEVMSLPNANPTIIGELQKMLKRNGYLVNSSIGFAAFGEVQEGLKIDTSGGGARILVGQLSH